MKKDAVNSSGEVPSSWWVACHEVCLRSGLSAAWSLRSMHCLPNGSHCWAWSLFGWTLIFQQLGCNNLNILLGKSACPGMVFDCKHFLVLFVSVVLKLPCILQSKHLVHLSVARVTQKASRCVWKLRQSCPWKGWKRANLLGWSRLGCSTGSFGFDEQVISLWWILVVINRFQAARSCGLFRSKDLHCFLHTRIGAALQSHDQMQLEQSALWICFLYAKQMSNWCQTASWKQREHPNFWMRWLRSFLLIFTIFNEWKPRKCIYNRARQRTVEWTQQILESLRHINRFVGLGGWDLHPCHVKWLGSYGPGACLCPCGHGEWVLSFYRLLYYVILYRYRYIWPRTRNPPPPPPPPLWCG